MHAICHCSSCTDRHVRLYYRLGEPLWNTMQTELNITKMVETILCSPVSSCNQNILVIGTTHAAGKTARPACIYVHIFAACNGLSSCFFRALSGPVMQFRQVIMPLWCLLETCVVSTMKLVSWVYCLDGVTKRTISALQTCFFTWPTGLS